MAAKAGTRADRIHKGEIGGEPKPKPAPAAPAEPVGEVYDTSSLTVADALKIAGDDKGIAEAMLASETADGAKNRSSLIDGLQSIINA